MNYSKPLGSGVFSEASGSACSLILCMVDLKSTFFLLILHLCLYFSQKDMLPYICTCICVIGLVFGSIRPVTCGHFKSRVRSVNSHLGFGSFSIQYRICFLLNRHTVPYMERVDNAYTLKPQVIFCNLELPLLIVKNPNPCSHDKI
jgi:hypothetical protein